MNLKNKLFYLLGESSGTVLAYSIVTGVFYALGKYVLTTFLKKIGVQHFAEIAESYRWIGQIVIEARHIFNADHASFYRCSNGKFYLENNVLPEVSSILPGSSHEDYINKNIKIYSVANKTRNKGITPLPDVLDDTFFEWFLQLKKTDSYIEQFTPDLPEYSKLRNNLDKFNIKAYFSIKIKKGNELYGIIVFTWSDIRQMPKQIIEKNREYLGNLKNTLLLETLFIVDRTAKFAIRKFFRLDK